MRNQVNHAKLDNQQHDIAASYVPVYVKGKLVFEYDPNRRLVRIVRNREKSIVDLTEYENGESSNR